MANKVFNVAVFFVVFRECLEAAVIVSVLLSFVQQAVGDADKVVHRKLKWQIWIGVALGMLICLAVGGGFIGAFYSLKKDIMGKTEDLWEGIFCMVATVMISVMGVAMLRINKLQAKWRVKIAQALVALPARRRDRMRLGFLAKRYAMFLLPFVTVLREGLEAVVFVAGAGVSSSTASASSYPLPVIVGLLAGAAVGALLYYGASRSSMQVFLILSTCILYLIAAGLCSRGAWFFENHRYNLGTGGDASESGSGNGSYNILQAVYHVNCCNPEIDNGWDIFNSLLGWQNTGYLASILAYNLYWLVLIVVLLLMIYDERHGHLPLCRGLRLRHLSPGYWLKRRRAAELTDAQKQQLFSRVDELVVTEDGVHAQPAQPAQPAAPSH
ncbi:AGR129Cp [Eremothecium gossypii ATCC 10895]|uniref:AGR129Cp n=1 Tax=Eremothecium gossypii (strain ATCC 10895 / CBS 109.51 / FGSC 9923 / NRRL Y-1056) TaxID=284811 RepID=Q74ZR9_EREGS|nr:AGR129Cp [Eremothecium gossypii ATCC 10895]AAS54619.1 AGR129Cp [Eremothecium gossypii ATCC 10895]AEY98949.1 FAGR129Cp [Eremothecium gossypii FDAG1]